MNGLALFAGVGGLELGMGLIIPDSKIVGYCERETYAASVLVERMERKDIHKAPIWAEVESFPAEIFRGKVDFITAGFPCQPFSKAGKGKGIEDERWLWDHIEKIIREVRPSFVCLENVTNLLNKRGFDRVLSSLATLGFDAEWSSFPASRIGAPHRRNRVFILGFKPDRISQFTHAMRDGCLQYKSEGGSNYRIKNRSLERGKFESLHTINEGWWGIEPPVCRVDDGMAYRMDRIKSCGNGVIPIQAAYAFASLACRAEGIPWESITGGLA